MELLAWVNPMGWEAWMSVGMLLLALAMLALTSIPPDVVMVGAVGVLLVTGVVAPGEALAGMSNEGMITVGLLFVVGAGVRETGAVDWIAKRIFGQAKTPTGAIVRLALPVTTLSAFMNNTPLVAMLIPAVNDWAKRQRISPSKLMIPLSYTAILGGTCTLIGTSTNLVVNGLFVKQIDPAGIPMFEITWVGVPCAVVGCLFLILTNKWLLPDRRSPLSPTDDPREYTAELLVEPSSPLVGKTIEEAGLRHLPGAYLAEVDRDGFIIPAVSPQERLRGNDRLVFVGIVESVLDLQRIRGLIPATEQVFKLAGPRSTRTLVEAVVSDTCPLVGKSIRDGKFRTHYNAVVIAVARNGERVNKKIGDVVLRAGDTLLVEAQPDFAERQRNSRDFFLVSQLDDSSPPRHERALISLMILGGMVASVTAGLFSMLQASMLAAGLMIVTRSCSVAAARRSVDWSVLLTIAASFALGSALESTGAAGAIAEGMISLAGGHPWWTLAVVYAITLLLTELITNNAAAALMFPMVIATAKNLDVSYWPFIIAVMMAASAGFATPIGYQTNLMVYGPGGYRFSDYVRIGVPLDFLVGATAVALAPWIWPFHPA